MNQPAGNALVNETSPYLLQHAHNPVAWQPWGEAALTQAREADKPILLSIGYSACHWCHVMAHESFEDPDTAALMNQLFVNIKVDREERPDLDKIYQTAHHLLAQRGGGWPLTVFLTPDDQTPFFSGTYFPPEPRHGLPAFKDLLKRVAGFYRERRAEIQQQNDSLLHVMQRMNPAATDGALNAAPLTAVFAELRDAFDQRYAGFGKAPKFPHPTNLERLLRQSAATSGEANAGAALQMVEQTLHAMAAGGIYDQLGGGFCRYSVDDRWMIPHFEKMLYDNGPLLGLYAEAWAATADDTYARIVRETATWIMREMQSDEGGYFSTLDADSEGVEGKYYIWNPDAARAVLNPDEYQVLSRHFGLDREANFEGQWHLHVFKGVQDIAAELRLDPRQVTALLDQGRHKLLLEREQRTRPGRDEKILTSWNGLMIRGMATAGRLLNEPKFVTSAERALDFVRATLWRDGRLLATCKDGRAHLMAYLDDYVFLIAGILELLQARWRDGDLAFAVQLAETVLAHFEDVQEGGFFFTASDHEHLIQRPKPFTDEAIPAGNGVAAWVLGRLGHLLGETRYLDAAQRTLQVAWRAIQEMPYAHTSLLNALEEYLAPPQTIVVRGPAEELDNWRTRLNTGYAPRRWALAIPCDSTDLPGLLSERTCAPPGVVAYVCEGHSCQAPARTLSELDAALAAAPSSRLPG